MKPMANEVMRGATCDVIPARYSLDSTLRSARCPASIGRFHTKIAQMCSRTYRERIANSAVRITFDDVRPRRSSIPRAAPAGTAAARARDLCRLSADELDVVDPQVDGSGRHAAGRQWRNAPDYGQ